MPAGWKTIGLALALVGMLGVGFAFAAGGAFLQTTQNMNGNITSVNNFDYWVEQGPGTFFVTSLIVGNGPASSSVASPSPLVIEGGYQYELAGAPTNTFTVGDPAIWIAFSVPCVSGSLPSDYPTGGQSIQNNFLVTYTPTGGSPTTWSASADFSLPAVASLTCTAIAGNSAVLVPLYIDPYGLPGGSGGVVINNIAVTSASYTPSEAGSGILGP